MHCPIMLTSLRLVIFATALAIAAAASISADDVDLKVAPYCNASACIAPECRCSLTTVPGNLSPAEIPQIILLTFDDAVNVLNYDIYSKLIFNRANPNGCNIQVTYFLSHEYNNYTLVNDLYSRHHEIASHSITHRTDSTFWQAPSVENWKGEMIDMVRMTEKFANISVGKIQGARAPFLLMGGNEMFTAYQTEGTIKWDCSWSTRNFMDPGMWPYTLKYRSYQECPVGRCPDESFPNMWVVPMVDLNDNTNNACAMLDTCNMGATANIVKETLMRNFLTHYNGNRSPFGLFLHAAWLQSSPVNYDGYKLFLDEMMLYDDVYFVTVSQLLEWVKQPTKTANLFNFAPWECKTPLTPCREQRCVYEPDKTPFGSERIMSMCAGQQCPFFYPWYNNIFGENPPTPFP